MKEISAKLKEARSKKGLSINEVSIATKINAKTLQAIEDADMNHLPAKPFLRGFIQTYSRYLELNVDEVMNRFAEEIGTTKPKIQQAGELPLSSTESHEESQRKIELYKKIGMAASAFIGALLIWGIFKIIGKYEAENKAAREQRQEVLKTETPVASANPTDSTTTAPITTEKPVEAVGVAQVKTETLVTDTKALTVDIKPIAAVATAPVAASPAPVIKAAPPASTPSTATIPAPAAVKTEVPVKPIITQVPVAEKKPIETKPEETKPTELKAPTARPQEVILEALDNVEIRYQKDGEGEKTAKLQPEKVFVIRAKEKVNLTVSDGGAINVIHNGKDKGVPGSLGQSVKLSYP